MPGLHEALQAIQQALDIGEMQSGRRFVKNVEVVAAAAQLAQFGRKLDALRFAAGQNGGGVAEFEITEAQLVQSHQLADDGALIGEESHALLNRKLEHLGYVAPLPGDFERFFTVTTPLARRTGYLDVRHEGQLRDDGAVARAFLAAPALDVE